MVVRAVKVLLALDYAVVLPLGFIQYYPHPAAGGGKVGWTDKPDGPYQIFSLDLYSVTDNKASVLVHPPQDCLPREVGSLSSVVTPPL